MCCQRDLSLYDITKFTFEKKLPEKWGRQIHKQHFDLIFLCCSSPGWIWEGPTPGLIWLHSLSQFSFFNPIRTCLLTKSASVSCATWCSVPLWWHSRTMKAKSTQNISVNKVSSPQVRIAALLLVLVNCGNISSPWQYIDCPPLVVVISRRVHSDTPLLLFPVPVTDCPSEAPPQPGLSQDPATDVQKPSPEGDVETPEPRADVDVTDPHRYCPLCAASFNNPQMALQHYNGRKHQRNRSRHKMLKELGNKVQQGSSVPVPTGNRWLWGFPGFQSR